jgi:hypothetical protein
MSDIDLTVSLCVTMYDNRIGFEKETRDPFKMRTCILGQGVLVVGLCLLFHSGFSANERNFWFLTVIRYTLPKSGWGVS